MRMNATNWSRGRLRESETWGKFRRYHPAKTVQLQRGISVWLGTKILPLEEKYRGPEREMSHPLACGRPPPLDMGVGRRTTPLNYPVVYFLKIFLGFSKQRSFGGLFLIDFLFLFSKGYFSNLTLSKLRH
jgi:hypothetical protein